MIYQKKLYYYNPFLLCFLYAKLLINFLYVSSTNISFLIDNITNSINLLVT